MANFFLIDQSLKKTGGHHADYAQCVADAAKEMGFNTVIGSHVSLPDPASTLAGHPIVRSFRKTIYQPDSYLAGLKHLTRSRHDHLNQDKSRSIFASTISFFARKRHRSRRDKTIRGFAVDCERFFKETIFSPNDHVFLTAVSELELLGLAYFLANNPRTIQVQWHLQFHFNLFEGRTPEYAKQLRTARAVQSCFDAAFSRIPYHAVHLYTTSETLADQYNRLGVANFESLPYPVSPRFSETPAVLKFESPSIPQSNRQEERSLKIGCPGEMRREKGFTEYLQPLVNKIWDSHLADGQIKFVVQRPEKKWPSKHKVDIQFPGSESAETTSTEPIEYLKHPLNDEEYLDFLQSTDCGLLFYDSRVYFSRRAGVLGELLSCGKPVIVPAGSWLADQIQQPISDHVDRVLFDCNPVRRFGVNELDWDKSNIPMPGGVVSFDQDRHPFECSWERDPSENAFVLSFDWHWPNSSGVYCRAEVIQKDDDQQTLSESFQVLGRDRKTSHTQMLFALHPHATRISIRLTNAFHDSQLCVKSLSLQTIETSNHPPIGAVGIIAADKQELPAAIEELVNHYDHYRETAVSFAKSWKTRHQPRRTIAHLLASQQSSARSA